MNQLIQDLKPEQNDLVVVPHHYEISEGLPFLIHKMKFLLTPSIIKSGGGFNMSFLEDLSKESIWEWITGKRENPEKEKVKEVIKSDATYDSPKFYRHVRPVDLNDKINLTSPGPRGGLTFYIELDAPNKTFAFSYSMCHSNDNFNKKVARHISKQRFDNEDWYEIKNYDYDLSVTTNIKFAIRLLLSKQDCSKLTESIQFSSVSDRINEYELNLIYERI